MFWIILFLLFGFALLIKSADYMVDGAAGIASHFKIPKMVVGLTLVAFATSAPEGTVSILAAMQGNAGIAVGNVIGSNMANMSLILGLSAYMTSMKVNRSTVTQGLPLTILATVVFLILGLDQFFQGDATVLNQFSFGDGLIFLLFFIVFLYYIFANLKGAQIEEKEMQKRERRHFKDTVWYSILLIAGGIFGVLVGGKLVVDNAVLIASSFGVSEALIGLTIVAVGTSLPELVTTVVAARKHENDLAMGNLIGSTVFNIFLVLGLAAIIAPLSFDKSLVLDALFSLVVLVIVFVVAAKEKAIGKWHGATLMIIYVFYLISLGFRESALAFLAI